MRGFISRINKNEPSIRINGKITSSEVRVVDAKGNMLGVMTIESALEAARNAESDLIEISPNANPPVCKIIDYGKFKYESHKKIHDARKKQKVVETKEVKFRPNIEQNDYDVKLRNIKRFLEDGNKVKISLRFKGREIIHNEIAIAIFNRLKSDTEDLAKIDFEPRMENRQMIMVLSSKKQN